MSEVEGVEVNFDAKTATVTCKAGKTLSREAAEKALATHGYGVTTFRDERGGG